MKKLLKKSSFWLTLSIISGLFTIIGNDIIIVSIPCSLVCAIQATYCFAIESIDKKYKNENRIS